MKLVLAGGTSHLGRILARSYRQQGNDVFIL